MRSVVTRVLTYRVLSLPNERLCKMSYSRYGLLILYIAILIGGSCSNPADDDDSLVIEWTEENTIVCYGNSLTAGVVEPDSSYPDFLAEKLLIEVVNLGRSGATSAWGLEHIDSVFNHDPVLVLLEFGGNDYLNLWMPDSARGNISAMIERILDEDVEVALLGFAHPEMVDCIFSNPAIQPYLAMIDSTTLELVISLGLTYAGMMGEIAEEYDLIYEDYLFEGIACDSTMLNWDIIHPNAAGNRRMAENVFETLYEVFEASGMLK